MNLSRFLFQLESAIGVLERQIENLEDMPSNLEQQNSFVSCIICFFVFLFYVPVVMCASIAMCCCNFLTAFFVAIND